VISFAKENSKFYPLKFILPAVLLLGVLLIWPIIYSGYISFFHYNVYTQENQFVGFNNFLRMFKDNVLGRITWNTIVFLVASVGIEILLGLELAVLLNRSFFGKGLIMALLSIPMIMPPVVVGFMWRFLLQAKYGWVNYFLTTFGLPTSAWYESPQLSLPCLILVDVWQWTPFLALIFLAGLTSVPKEPIESALIDGATSNQVFMRIVLPQLMPVLKIGIIFRFIGALKSVDVMWILTEGGPGYSSELISSYIYRVVWSAQRIGYAAAISLIIVNILSFFGTRFVKEI
jgi:multiple sugar transport system permease protein